MNTKQALDRLNAGRIERDRRLRALGDNGSAEKRLDIWQEWQKLRAAYIEASRKEREKTWQSKN